MPQNIIIVGGSLAGLIHGLQLKREGNNVTVLERDPRSLRSSHNAGIAYRANMKEFLEKYDDTNSHTAIECNRLHLTYHPRPSLFTKVVEKPLRYDQTSWGSLYRLLRANFDGYASKAFPEPPPRRSDDGEAKYLTGKQVIDLKRSGDIVSVHYIDHDTGEVVTQDADLVIGADGVRSIVRQIVQAPALSEYAGFVSWRGTVPERELSESAAIFFANGFVYDLMKRNYILCYLIPTDEGGIEQGQRLVNWVWYFNIAEGSKDMRDIFTDQNGKLHGNTVSQGLVSSSVWARFRAAGVSKMSDPFKELLNKPEQPFVTKVNDVFCTKARHWGDRVLLVGDALMTLRPNIAMSTEQAANQSLLLSKALKGETTMKVWEQKAVQFSERFFLLSRVVAGLGLGSWLTFLNAIRRYLAFLVVIKWKRA